MLIKKDKNTFLDYLEDASGLKGGFASEVIFPESENELIAFLKEANLKIIPVTISAARTGVTGGSVPFGGTLISTENLNRTLEIHRDKGLARVGCSIRLRELEEALLKEGFFYPVDPTEKNASIGGNIATNASGARSFKFGSTRDYVLSLRIILPDGDALFLRRGEHFCDERGYFRISTESKKTLDFKIPDYKMPDIKNAAGYFVKENMDLIDLFVGQEGTLGIITEAEIRLLKSQRDILAMLSFFKREEEALSFSDKMRGESLRVRFSETLNEAQVISIEYFDPKSIDMLRMEYKNIPQDTDSAVFFEHLITQDSKSDLLERYGRILLDFDSDIDKSWCAADTKTREKLYDFRHRLPVLVNEQVKKNGFPKIGSDIAVPFKNFRNMYTFYKDSLKGTGIDYVIFGHIGNCHLHLNLLPKVEKEFLDAKNLYLKFIERALLFNGTISAEHGVGKLKHAYLERMYSKESVLQMAELKKAFDPNCILNLDNIFPKEYLPR